MGTPTKRETENKGALNTGTTPSAAPVAGSHDSAPASYEAALAELDTLVSRMEDGNLSLEDSLSAYRRGAVLVAYCQQQLEQADQQVRVLDGESLKPLVATAMRTVNGEGNTPDEF